MVVYKIIFHSILIKNANDQVPWKSKAIHIGKIPKRLIFKKVINNIPIFQDSLIRLVEKIDKHEKTYISGADLTRILKKEYGVLELKN